MDNSITVCELSDQKPSTSTGMVRRRKPQQTIKHTPTVETFWPHVLEDVKSIRTVDAKNQNLPLARIKKIMKLDENAKMIAAEAPLLFAKACEFFIQELTLRAWVHTEENKRRTLQRSDIATAISIYDQFDFLIDIVPREESKPLPSSSSAAMPATTTPTTTTTTTSTSTIKKEIDLPKQETQVTNTVTVSNEPIQYYLQLGQQQQPQAVLQSSGGLVNQAIPINATGGATGLNLVTPQNIILAANTTAQQQQQQALVNSIQNQQQPQIQLFQQVITPTGEIQNVPITITQQQLNLLRMQMQGNAGNIQQQLLIPTMQAHQQTQLLQIGASSAQTPATTSGIFINTGQGSNEKNPFRQN